MMLIVYNQNLHRILRVFKCYIIKRTNTTRIFFNSCLRALTKHLHIVYEITNLTNKLSKELFECMSESAN